MGWSAFTDEELNRNADLPCPRLPANSTSTPTSLPELDGSQTARSRRAR